MDASSLSTMEDSCEKVGLSSGSSLQHLRITTELNNRGNVISLGYKMVETQLGSILNLCLCYQHSYIKGKSLYNYKIREQPKWVNHMHDNPPSISRIAAHSKRGGGSFHTILNYST